MNDANLKRNLTMLNLRLYKPSLPKKKPSRPAANDAPQSPGPWHMTQRVPLYHHAASSSADAAAPPHFTVFLILGCGFIGELYRRTPVAAATARHRSAP